MNELISNHSGVALPSTAQPVFVDMPRSSSGLLRVAIDKNEAAKTTIITPNWCDKTTWYQQSILVEDEIAQHISDNKIYQVSHQFLIDTYHGKLTQEDFLVDDNNNSFLVVVKVDGITKTERDPHFGIGGDYEINYEAGTINFFEALSSSAVVTVNYHYATSSLFIIQPSLNKSFRFTSVEVQFSEDVVLLDSFIFQAFAGSYPLGNPLIYKTFQDFINDSCKVYPLYPPMGGTNWRSIQKSSLIFNWDYVASTRLLSSLDMKIKVYLQHDVPCSGTIATSSFYGIEEDETL